MFISTSSFLTHFVSQASIMVYRCQPMSPKWMMIIVTKIFAWILYSSPQKFSPISSGYLRFFLFSVILMKTVTGG